MLNRLSIEAAWPVVKRLEERNLVVLPNEGTPLMSLTMAIDRTMVDSDLAENSSAIEVLQNRSKTDAHLAAKADIIKLASASIARLHDTVRNTVLPHVKAVAASLNDYVSARRVESILPYSIEMKEIPAVYSNAAIRKLIDRYPTAQGADFAIRAAAPTLDIDAVKELCKTGMAGVDAEMETVLSMDNCAGYAAIQGLLHGRIGPRQIHVDFLPGVLVAFQAIYDEPTSGVEMALNEYHGYVNGILCATAFLAKAAWTRYDLQLKAQSLYSSEPRTSITSIKVMGKVYRDLLEKGLTPEALIGNEMSGRRFSQGELIDNKAALEQIYVREMNLRDLKAQAEIANVVRAGLNQILGGELAAREMEADEREAANVVLKTMVAGVKERNCDDLNQLATAVVCGVFYPKTDAITFIDMINRVGRNMPDDTDPREVTLMATIRYVNRWLARQMGVVEA